MNDPDSIPPEDSLPTLEAGEIELAARGARRSLWLDGDDRGGTIDLMTVPEPQEDPGMAGPLNVIVHLAFAFDIGDEIDLDRARELLHGELGRLPRRKRTPESIGYRPPPIRVPLEPAGIRLPGDPPLIREPRAELTLFDFGAISLAVQFPVSATPESLLELAGSLAEPAPLNESARQRPGPLDRAASPRRLRLLREPDERGVHRLPARRATRRLARRARRLDRRARPPGGRAAERDRGPRGHPACRSPTRPPTSSFSTGPPASSPTRTVPTRCR